MKDNTKLYKETSMYDKTLFRFWTWGEIKRAFNCGNGSIKDMERYIENNNNITCYIKKI